MSTASAGCAPWVAEYWLVFWFEHRHSGTAGHSAEQARRHVRYWIGVAREARS